MPVIFKKDQVDFLEVLAQYDSADYELKVRLVATATSAFEAEKMQTKLDRDLIMSSLVDHQIRTLCREMGLVEPFDPDLVQPASIDVRLGNVIKREGRVCGPVEGRQEWVTEYIKDGDSFELFPGAFILAHTKGICAHSQQHRG